MISVIIPTLDAELDLAKTLISLIPSAIEGIVKEVIIVDGGSVDLTLKIAEEAGAKIITSERGRGTQLRKGASQAKNSWLLFLHADTQLEAGWEKKVFEFIEKIEGKALHPQAAAFRFKLSDTGFKPRLLEILVGIRCWLLKLPFGDQGLLMSRRLYSEINGYSCYPIMEDVDIIRRLGRKRITLLPIEAITSARRYKMEGYIKRTLKNQLCLILYLMGIKTEILSKMYEKKPTK